jgi:pSer/pThr/pTyr-binding forkhead associated (FHA) protein
MTVDLLSIAAIAAMTLALIAAAQLIKQRQGRARPWRQQSLPGPAAPDANPLLRDETLLGTDPGGPGARGPGAVAQVSVVAGAPQQTYTLHAGRPLMIGRHAGHDISLQSQRVSRDHARLLLLQGGQLQISDLGSTNGTFVGRDGRRLAPHAPEPLAPGDVFWIGPEVKLVVGAAPAGALG